MRIDPAVEMEKLRAAVARPKMTNAGRAVNPDEQPQLTRYTAIARHIARGKTYDAAVKLYDAPRGICACGKPARAAKGRVCDECARRMASRRISALRASGRLTAPVAETGPGRPCACGCGRLVFARAQKRTVECAARYKAEQDRERQRQRYEPKRVTAVVRVPPPSLKPVELDVPATPVDVTGHTVKRVPSLMRGLRNLFGDEQGQCWNAAD